MLANKCDRHDRATGGRPGGFYLIPLCFDVLASVLPVLVFPATAMLRGIFHFHLIYRERNGPVLFINSNPRDVFHFLSHFHPATGKKTIRPLQRHEMNDIDIAAADIAGRA